jgi:hypothetical protein
MKRIGALLFAAVIAAQPRAHADTPATSGHKNFFDMTPDTPAAPPKTPQAAPNSPAVTPYTPVATPSTQPAAPAPQAPVINPQAAPSPETTVANPPPPAASTAPVLLRVPSENELVDAKRRIDQLYEAEFSAAKTPGKKLDLAESLIATALEEKSDHAGQFQLLTIARDLAIEGHDFQLACQAIGQLGSLFYIDPMQMMVTAAGACRGPGLPNFDRRLLCLQVQGLVPKLIAAGRFDLVATVDEISHSVASSASDGSLVRQMRHAAEAHAAARVIYDSLEVARQKLRAKPTDPDSNTVIGRYNCFELNDWKTGLAMLAMGSDRQLKDLASAELNGPPESLTDSFANQWWDIAESQNDPVKHRIEAHAATYYARALPSLTGLAKKEIARRIEQARELPADNPAAINLLELIDPSRDVVTGNWSKSAIGLLQCDGGGLVAVPYHPPAEYEYRVVFTRTKGKDALALICTNGLCDRQFAFLLGAWSDSVAGFSLVNFQAPDRNVTGVRGHWITDGIRQTLLVRVRTTGTQVMLDDKPLGPEFHTDFRDMNLSDEDFPSRFDVLGLRAFDSSFTIHSADVVEITGHGHAVTGDAVDAPVIATATYLRAGKRSEPFTVTFHSDGKLDSTINAHGMWTLRGSDLLMLWGRSEVTCKLSADRKSFTGKHTDGGGAAVTGRFTDGGL